MLSYWSANRRKTLSYWSVNTCCDSLQANLRHAIAPGQQVAMQAQLAIPAGTELTIRYTHMLQPLLRRRAQIEVRQMAAAMALASQLQKNAAAPAQAQGTE